MTVIYSSFAEESIHHESLFIHSFCDAAVITDGIYSAISGGPVKRIRKDGTLLVHASRIDIEVWVNKS